MKFFFFSSRRRHTRCSRDWSSDVCSSDLKREAEAEPLQPVLEAVEGGDVVLPGIALHVGIVKAVLELLELPAELAPPAGGVGRAAVWGRRVDSGGGGSFKKKKNSCRITTT